MIGNRYRNLLPLLINGEHGQGDEFTLELSEDDENTNIASGLLEILPREFRVIGESRVFETEKGETFTRALTLGQQKHLIEGGFIEPVEDIEPATEPAKAKRQPRKRKG